jgi:hypothetical protein
LQKALKDKSIQVEDKGNEIVVTREKSKAKYEKEIDINEYVVHDGKIIKASAIPEVKPEKTQEQMIQQLHAKFNKLSKGKSLTLDEAAKVAEKLPDADDIIV